MSAWVNRVEWAGGNFGEEAAAAASAASALAANASIVGGAGVGSLTEALKIEVEFGIEADAASAIEVEAAFDKELDGASAIEAEAVFEKEIFEIEADASIFRRERSSCWTNASAHPAARE